MSALGQRNSDKKLEEAERLQYLQTAKEMAMRSAELKDSILQALVAIQAHNFWTKNKGSYANNDIYRGLYLALKCFKDPVINTLPVRINQGDNREYAITKLMAEKLCSRMKRNMFLEEWNKFASHLKYEPTCSPAK